MESKLAFRNVKVYKYIKNLLIFYGKFLMAAPLTRRNFLGGLVGASALSAFGSSALGQQPVALVLPPSDQFQLSHEYPKESKDGYTKFTMDRLRGLDDAFGDNGKEGVSAPFYLRTELDLAAIEAGTPRPIFITNFVDNGPEDRNAFESLRSKQQSEMFEEILPDIAAKSQRPVVLLEISAIGKDREGKPEGVFLGALMAAVQENTLGPGHVPVNIPDDSWVVPYFQLDVDGIEVYDASFKQYGTEFDVNQIKAQQAANVAITARRSNEDLIARLEL